MLLSVMQQWFIQQTVSILYTWQDTGQSEGVFGLESMVPTPFPNGCSVTQTPGGSPDPVWAPRGGAALGAPLPSLHKVMLGLGGPSPISWGLGDHHHPERGVV